MASRPGNSSRSMTAAPTPPPTSHSPPDRPVGRTAREACATISAMTTALALDSLYKPVQPELDLVRARVNEFWHTALQLVDNSIGYQPEMGGKLLRPALCLLSAGAVGAEDLEQFVTMATSMELLHVASLVHDDVVDDSDIR